MAIRHALLLIPFVCMLYSFFVRKARPMKSKKTTTVKILVAEHDQCNLNIAREDDAFNCLG